tara:strand:- start:2182 stop:2412 length:231 start_codon:yes stop_codon:yes gene_type:complete
MFYASLLFCFIGFNGPQCLVAEDKRGPYTNITACRKRLDEMSTAILTELPMSSVRSKLCRNVAKEEEEETTKGHLT